MGECCTLSLLLSMYFFERILIIFTTYMVEDHNVNWNTLIYFGTLFSLKKMLHLSNVTSLKSNFMFKTEIWGITKYPQIRGTKLDPFYTLEMYPNYRKFRYILYMLTLSILQ